MANTFRANLASVLEHSLVVAAATELARAEPRATFFYIDTHAMAPLNAPLSGEDAPFTDALTAAVDMTARGSAETGGLAAVLREAVDRKRAGARAYYPTHFVFAARAVERAGRRLRGILFENDGAGLKEFEGRREMITRCLADPRCLEEELGIQRSELKLAPAPGDFRAAECWPRPVEPEERGGTVVLLFSDPCHFVKPPARRTDGRHMDEYDLQVLRERIERAFVQQTRAVVHTAFLTNNDGTGDARGYGDAVRSAWLGTFGSSPAMTSSCAILHSDKVLLLAGCTRPIGASGTADQLVTSIIRQVQRAATLLGRAPLDVWT